MRRPVSNPSLKKGQKKDDTRWLVAPAGRVAKLIVSQGPLRVHGSNVAMLV